jgi:putative holliday junction resolvase
MLSIRPLAEMPQILRRPVRLAALDIGTKTIGIALSTPDWQMATPLTTIQRTKWTEDLKALDKALSGYGIGGLIVGLPVHMDETDSPQAQSVRQTVYNLIKSEPAWIASGGIIAFWDERLSTAAAAELTGSSEKAKTSGALDAVAAQIILERALKLLTDHLKKDS